MTGPINHDSMSRFTEDSGRYSAISRPKPQLEVKDVLQPNAEPEKNVAAKTTGLILPHDSFVAVVQTGKYVFLAIMIPPYLCLYGIPKWFITNILPKGFDLVNNQMASVGKFLYDLGSRVKDMMRNLMGEMVGSGLSMGNHQAKKFMELMTKSLNAIGKNIGQIIEKAGTLIAKVQAKIAGFGEPVVLRVKEMVSEFAKNAGEKIKGVSEFVQMAMQPVLAPLVALATVPVFYIRQILTATLEKVETMIQVVSEKVIGVAIAVRESVISPVISQIQTVSLAVGRPVVSFMQTTVQATSQTIWSAFGVVAATIVAPLQVVALGIERALRNTSEKLSQIGEKVSESVKNLNEVVYNMAINLFVQVWNKVPTFERGQKEDKGKGKGEGKGQSELESRGFKQMVKRIGKGVIAGVGTTVATATSYLAQMIGMVVTYVVDLGLKLKGILLVAPKYVWKVIVRVLKMVKSGLYIFAAVIYTLLKVSIEQTRILTEELIGKTSVKK